MTIENARALQEQLANEAIAQLRKNGNNELVDDCIQSIAVVGKAQGIPGDETARRQERAQQEQTRHVGDAGPRETMGTRHHAPDMFTRVMQFVWDMFETALNLGDDADSPANLQCAARRMLRYQLPNSNARISPILMLLVNLKTQIYPIVIPEYLL